MGCAFLTPLEKDEASICGRDEPQQHVHHIDPCRALHPNNAAVALWILMDIHLAKDAEQYEPEKPDCRVDHEEHPGLNKRDHEDDGHDGRDGATEDGVDPFRVGVLVCFAGIGKVLGVQTDDNDTHDKLEEAENDAHRAEGRDVRRERGPGGCLFALERATAEEVQHDGLGFVGWHVLVCGNT